MNKVRDSSRDLLVVEVHARSVAADSGERGSLHPAETPRRRKRVADVRAFQRTPRPDRPRCRGHGPARWNRGPPALFWLLRTGGPDRLFQDLIRLLNGDPLLLSVPSSLRTKLTKTFHCRAPHRLVRLGLQFDDADNDALILPECMTKQRLEHPQLIRFKTSSHRERSFPYCYRTKPHGGDGNRWWGSLPADRPTLHPISRQRQTASAAGRAGGRRCRARGPVKPSLKLGIALPGAGAGTVGRQLETAGLGRRIEAGAGGVDRLAADAVRFLVLAGPGRCRDRSRNRCRRSACCRWRCSPSASARGGCCCARRCA